MPGGDRTGPWGQGPGTGWGAGGCVPRGRGRRFGGGFGWGRGWGRGRGWGFGPAFGPAMNYTITEELEDLKAEREEIDKRLAEIEREKKK